MTRLEWTDPASLALLLALSRGETSLPGSEDCVGRRGRLAKEVDDMIEESGEVEVEVERGGVVAGDGAIWRRTMLVGGIARSREPDRDVDLKWMDGASGAGAGGCSCWGVSVGERR